MVRLVRTARRRNSACFLRSSGTRPMPCIIASRGPANDTGWPSTRMAARSNLSAPNIARADQPGEPQNFALVGAKRHIDEFDRMRIARGPAPSEALDLERDGPMFWNRPLAVERADVAPDHHADDLCGSRVGDTTRADVMAVA